MADLRALSYRWGVTSVEERDIESDAMLLPDGSGYSIVLKRAHIPSQGRRQRFSLAHELGHLLSQKFQEPGLRGNARLQIKHRNHDYTNEEEILCNRIAAEILMPRLVFQEDAWMEGWSLRSLRTLSPKYDTSLVATAKRMVELMPEPCLLSIWKPPHISNEIPRLQSYDTGRSHYGIRNASLLPRESLRLVTRALDSHKVESGFAPVVDTKHGTGRPIDVPAEALAWGRGEYRQVMVFHYPSRS